MEDKVYKWQVVDEMCDEVRVYDDRKLAEKDAFNIQGVLNRLTYTLEGKLIDSTTVREYGWF